MHLNPTKILDCACGKSFSGHTKKHMHAVSYAAFRSIFMSLNGTHYKTLQIRPTYIHAPLQQMAVGSSYKGISLLISV